MTGDGIVATYSYDDANQLTAISYANGGTTVGNLSYSYMTLRADGSIRVAACTKFSCPTPPPATRCSMPTTSSRAITA